MIILFNLNTYLGGGEVLLIRLAHYLKKNDIDFLIITKSKDSYIGNECQKNDFNALFWPVREQSVVYMDSSELKLTVEYFQEYFKISRLYNVVTFCFRDLYNSLYFFPKIRSSSFHIVHGVYHPEDIYYLSSFSLKRKQIVNFNRKLAKELCLQDSLLFYNENAKLSTIGDEKIYRHDFFPLPVNISANCVPKNFNGEKIKIICISRFVSFKIAAVLAIVKFVHRRPEIELNIVGFGPYIFVLKIYKWLYNINNVSIHTNVNHNDLSNYIDDANIGYAQGTSILEIAKNGLPVIVAPYSRVLDLFKGNYKVSGVFGDSPDLDFGDYYFHKLNNGMTINDALCLILSSYEKYSLKSIELVRKVDSDIIFDGMLKAIKSSKFEVGNYKFDYPRPPIIKQLLRKLWKRDM